MRMQLTTALAALLVSTLAFSDSSGEGTYYGYSGGGNCSFPVPDDIDTAAMNATDYSASMACGGVIVVTNTDTDLSVTVRIDDQCPECAEGDVDLSQEAFEQIAELSTGRIPITWHYIANPVAGNIKLYFKDGSSQYWTAVQVRDHLYPVASLAYRQTSSGNDYVSVTRESYNYFVKDAGFGTGPYDFRLTDFCGQSVDIDAISLSVTTEIDTGVQFPTYSGDDCDIAASISDTSTTTDSDSASNSSGGALGLPIVVVLILGLCRRHR